MSGFDVVIPTSGRASLLNLLRALATQHGPRPQRVIVVDDRQRADTPLDAPGAEVVRGRAAGPAAARNVGWRKARATWVAFLDDDVVPDGDWLVGLADDLAGCGRDVAATQGRIHVPLPSDRRPTDWERNVAGLETARWATADMAFRHEALERVGGFDERFPRAYREDADLGLRLTQAGWRIQRGQRTVGHPVGPADRWVSLRKQQGNADDVLMRGLHGRDWRRRAGAPRGRLPIHLITAALGALAACTTLAAFAGSRSPGAIAFVSGLGWLGATAELARRRIAPGPRTRHEVATIVLTSAAMPFAAARAWIAGHARKRRLLANSELAPQPRRIPVAVLLDRDGTLVVDVPYNGDPALVEPMPGAREALDRLRAAGVRVGVVSNQSGVARGLISERDVAAVNARIEFLLGPIGTWLVCAHGPDDGCDCRKPRPGLVLQAAHLLGVAPRDCAVIGDIGADVEAAHAAGARGVLVPTAMTRPEEVAAAPEVASDLREAAELLTRDAR
jgi:histidinol-phosphate phosphatase family protein